MSLYISTSCLKQKMDLLEMLNLFQRLNLRNVEVGVWEKWDQKGCLDLLTRKNFNLIVHNYFPPPEESFVINLASQNEKILERSRRQIKRSIDFCRNLNIPLFSFHSGFRIDPNRNFKFDLNQDNIPDYETSFKIFKESIKEIAKYAELKNIQVAVENNTLERRNLINGKNMLLLMTEAQEFERLFRGVPSKNLGILLDLGHLKVSASSLNFDIYEFIEKLKGKVFGIHLHDNNGMIDQHSGLKEGSWCFEVINKYFKNIQIPVVMEGKYLNIEELINNKNLIEKSLKYE